MPNCARLVRQRSTSAFAMPLTDSLQKLPDYYSALRNELAADLVAEAVLARAGEHVRREQGDVAQRDGRKLVRGPHGQWELALVLGLLVKSSKFSA